MSPSHSMLEMLLLGFPILGMLFLAFFRLDELIAKPRRHAAAGHPLSHRDSNGQSICIEPDGRYLTSVPRTRGGSLLLRQPGDFPRRGEVGRVRRVWVTWVENSED